MSEEAIAWRTVSKRYRVAGQPDVHALSALDLELLRGETLCLIGPSGCGKTTTLRLANRLAEPTAGEVRVHGRDVRQWDPIALRRGIGYVVQRGGLFPHRTVADNVAILCEVEGWSAARRAARVAELLDVVQLPAHHAARYPAELSGGERQRVGIARALALDPDLLFLDEPFGALDRVTRADLQRSFAALARGERRSILFVTHDLDEAFLLGDRVALFDRGRLAQVGTEDELRTHPASAFVEHFLAEVTR